MTFPECYRKFHPKLEAYLPISSSTIKKPEIISDFSSFLVCSFGGEERRVFSVARGEEIEVFHFTEG